MTTEPCLHLRSLAAGDPAPRQVLVLDFHHGMTDSVVRCETCAEHHLLELVDWGGERTQRRIYRVSKVPASVVEVYARNIAKGSCDINRAANELHALTTSSEPTPFLLAIDVDTDRVLALARVAEPATIPLTQWRERLPEPENTRWFELLGIEKEGTITRDIGG